jgi:hypothetical protein
MDDGRSKRGYSHAQQFSELPFPANVSSLRGVQPAVERTPTMSSRFWSLYIFWSDGEIFFANSPRPPAGEGRYQLWPAVNPNAETRDPEVC